MLVLFAQLAGLSGPWVNAKADVVPNKRKNAKRSLNIVLVNAPFASRRRSKLTIPRILTIQDKIGQMHCYGRLLVLTVATDAGLDRDAYLSNEEMNDDQAA